MIPIQAVIDYREVVKLINIEIDTSGGVDSLGEGGDPYVETMGVNRYRLQDFHTLVPNPIYPNTLVMPSTNVYDNDNPNTRVLVKDNDDEFRTFTVDLPYPVLIDDFDMLEVTS